MPSTSNINVPVHLFISDRYDQTKGVNRMKTAEEIIAYLEMELAEAYELHDQAKGKDAAQAFAYLLKATTIQHLLDEITHD